MFGTLLFIGIVGIIVFVAWRMSNKRTKAEAANLRSTLVLTDIVSPPAPMPEVKPARTPVPKADLRSERAKELDRRVASQDEQRRRREEEAEAERRRQRDEDDSLTTSVIIGIGSDYRRTDDDFTPARGPDEDFKGGGGDFKGGGASATWDTPSEPTRSESVRSDPEPSYSSPSDTSSNTDYGSSSDSTSSASID